MGQKIWHANTNSKNVEVGILISDNVDSKSGGTFQTVKKSSNQEDGTILNVCVPSNSFKTREAETHRFPHLGVSLFVKLYLSKNLKYIYLYK